MTAPKIDPTGDGIPVASDVSIPASDWKSTLSDKTQQVASPSFTLRLRGVGVRLAYRVQPPKLISYGGQPAILSNEVVTEETVGIAANVLAYRTSWDLTYIIPAAPSSLPLLANPMLGTDGGATGDATGTGPLQSGVIG